MGQTHGFNLVTNTSLLDEKSEAKTVTLDAGDFTMSMDKTSEGTSAKDVKPGDTNVDLATLDLVSDSEDAVILDMTVTIEGNASTSDELIENVELVNTNTGGVYDLTLDTGEKYTIADDIYLSQGVVTTFEVRADILDAAPEDETLQVKIASASTDLNIEGEVSGIIIDNITPSSITGPLLTVKKASLTLETTVLNSVNVVGGATDVVLYQGQLEAGTADDIRLQSVKLTAGGDTSAFNNNDISLLTLYLNGSEIDSVSNNIASNAISFTSLSGDNIVPAGDTVNLIVKGSFASTISTTGTFDLSIDGSKDVVSRSVDGNDLVYANDTTDSRSVTTVDNGELKVDLLTSASEVNKDAYVLAGTTSDRYMGELKFTTQNEDIKVEKLVLNRDSGDADNSDIAKIELVDADGNVVDYTTVDSSGNATFDPFNIVFDADESTSLYIRTVAKGINVDGEPTSTAEDGKSASYSINDVEAMGVNSGATLTMTGSGSALSWNEFDNSTASKTNTIVGSKVTSISNNLSDGTLTGGTTVVGEYKFVFDNDENRTSDNEALEALLKDFKVTFSLDTATVSDIKLYIDGEEETKVSATSTAEVTGTSGTATWEEDELATLADSGHVDGEVTFVIEGTVSGLGDNSYVQTSLDDLSGGDFSYYSDGTGTNFLTDMLLPYSSVTGATLSR
jgi:hypothetical protein